MQMRRFWIEIVLLGSVIACALALLMATLGAAAGAVDGSAALRQPAPAGTARPQEAAQASQPEQAYEGIVTCSQCGAKHSISLDRSASECVRVCVHGGASFALVNDETSFILDGDVSSFKKLAGQRSRVVGTLRGKTIKVSSVAAVT